MQLIHSNIALYNRDDLLSLLDVNTKCTDIDIFLKLYQKLDVKMFDYINADFSFVIYDETKKSWLAARDCMGIKALYYTSKNGEYFFANDMDELFKISHVEKNVNISAMRTLFNNSTLNYEDTMYEGINRVPPGHYLEVTKGIPKLNRYWFPEKITINREITLDEATKKFNYLFEKAIFSRIEEEDIAYELSGGLDSSSIVSVVKTHYPNKDINTYSMTFDKMDCDEEPYIQSLEDKFSFHSHKIDIHKLDYGNVYDMEFNYKMSPHWPILLTFTMYFPMIEEMKKNNTRIIITGQGGDHVLAGNCYTLSSLLKQKAYKKIWKEIQATLHFRTGVLSCALLDILTTKQKKYIKHILKFKMKEDDIRNYKQIINPFLAQNGIDSALKADISYVTSASQSMVQDSNILHVIEKNYNVEYRHPFYDKHLVEFIFTLPPEYKYSEGVTKLLLRMSMQNILPEKIRLRRSKAEFSKVLMHQINAMNMNKVFNNNPLVELGLITQDKLNILKKELKNKTLDSASIVELWKIVNITYWYNYSLSFKLYTFL